MVSTTVSTIDKYGNVIFAMPNAELQSHGFEAGDIVTLTIGAHQSKAPVGTAYSDVAVGSPVLVLYKDGRLIEQAVPDMLASLNGGKPCTDKTVQEAAARYLKERVGLTETELKALKEALS